MIEPPAALRGVAQPADSYIGRAVERLEDARMLRGLGRYVDDEQPRGLLHAAFFRSPLAHARLRALDVSKALALPGVHAAFSAADLPAPIPQIPLRMEPRPELARFEQPLIAHGKVRYVGEPIAVVVADSAAQAEDAVAAIEIDLEALPAITGGTQATPEYVWLFEEHPTHHAMTITAARGDADAVFREAPYTRRERFQVQRHGAVPMETRGVLAAWDAAHGKLAVWGSMKVPFAIRALLAKLMQLPEHAITVNESDTGGGFGMRGEFYPEDFWIPYAARRLARPVKWIEGRGEHFTASSHAREVTGELEIACRRDGTLLALRGHARADMGAYLRPNAVTAPRNLAQMIAGPYHVPHLHMAVDMLLSNKTPAASYRGPGRFEADFFRERLFDIAAKDLGIDRVAFRRRNLVQQGDMPYPLATVQPYGSGGEFDSGDYSETFDRCLAEIGWAQKSAMQGQLIDGRYHGLGLGCYVEGGASGPKENARLTLAPDGTVSVYTGSSAIGQGLETIFAQIAADALGIDMARIRGVFHGSTSHVSEGFGSYASRATVMGGSALLDAAANLNTVIRHAAAAQFGCAPDDVTITPGLRQVVANGKSRHVAELSAEGFEAEGAFVNSKRTYSYGTHAAHVAVDPHTGQVQVLDYVAVEDVGRIINPATLHGQTVGAIVQGLGGALLEQITYDAEGQLLTGTFADYALPAAGEFACIRTIALENHPSPANPLGAKGAGEGGIIPVGGVIANAVAAALASFKVSPCALPLSSHRVWALIQAAA